MDNKIVSFKTAKALKDAGIIIPSERYYRGADDNYAIVYPGWDVKEECLPADVYHAPDFNEIWDFLPYEIEPDWIQKGHLELRKSKKQYWKDGSKNDISIAHYEIGYDGYCYIYASNAFKLEKPLQELAAELCFELQTKGLLK